MFVNSQNMSNLIKIMRLIQFSINSESISNRIMTSPMSEIPDFNIRLLLAEVEDFQYNLKLPEELKLFVNNLYSKYS